MPSRLLCALLLAACQSSPSLATKNEGPPNIVLVFTDDQGYGDLSCNGHPTIHTPHIDALAANGIKLTQFYVASPVCSPSRAALLTGCYPNRIGILGALGPKANHGIHADETTLA